MQCHWGFPSRSFWAMSFSLLKSKKSKLLISYITKEVISFLSQSNSIIKFTLLRALFYSDLTWAKYFRTARENHPKLNLTWELLWVRMRQPQIFTYIWMNFVAETDGHADERFSVRRIAYDRISEETNYSY